MTTRETHLACSLPLQSQTFEGVHINCSSLLLKNLDNRECCRSFRVCILVDNFIAKIDSLIACLLHLHDNNMGTRKNIEDLSGCPNLTALTLYDKPPVLKGLRITLISDEEIIENWKLIKGCIEDRPFSPTTYIASPAY
uniref:Uncharacterized protein n=1 Tax=Hucho hucho TaxID=62062 RepID=A0A4W5R2E5_9TELE